MENYIIILSCSIFLICIIIVFQLSRSFHKSFKSSSMDDMEGVDFEQFCASLLKNHGFTEIELTKASGDFGIDILAQKEGITFAIQCKRYQDSVGVKAIQEAYFGRDYYDCMVGAVMTNQYFTAPAVEAAKKLKILLWDRGYIDSMIEEEQS